MAKLYFRYGAMGCGKTMQLLQVAFNYEERGHRVCVMKPKTDTKNGEDWAGASDGFLFRERR